ncbi:unnamed protein product [Polarella glacialis]|uniref:Uncharacterized protein n=1 Tax=Polarella glacialis TaxID=89957 RepID=A0A813HXL2_POLGL|nr:unnamed protein product [Polarella glacialis]
MADAEGFCAHRGPAASEPCGYLVGAAPVSSKPSFLRPAFDTTPVTPALPSDDVLEPEMPQFSSAMAQLSCDSRPPSSSGERSRALSQGYVKISEVESTKRLNDSLELDNARLEAEMADLLRLNLQMRDNISCMEDALGIVLEARDLPEDDEEETDEFDDNQVFSEMCTIHP